jgi:hypothetical protein
MSVEANLVAKQYHPLSPQKRKKHVKMEGLYKTQFLITYYSKCAYFDKENTHVNYQEQELKKTVNQCQYQNDSDARII